MIERLRQVGKLLLLGLCLIIVAQEAKAATDDPYRSARRVRDETESSEIDGVFVRVGDWFDRNFLSDEEEAASGRKGSRKTVREKEVLSEEADEGEASEEPKTIRAKRLDSVKGEEKKAAEKDPPPYKVYPSPVIVEDNPSYNERPYADSPEMPKVEYEAPKIEEGYEPPKITIYTPQPKETAMKEMSPALAADSFSGWSSKMIARTIDTSKPPPLPDYVKRGLPMPLESAKQEKPTVAATAAVPPISALPKQFFPVLPAGALPDTPPQLLPVASNKELEADNADVTRAIIVIHDIQRGSAEGVATLMTLSGASPESTLIIAPQFPLGVDIVRFAAYLPDQGRTVARWSVEAGWQNGGDSFLQNAKLGVSSFSAVDLLLLYLSDRRRFPMLAQVVVAGHGMGADFVQRYAAFGQAPDILKKEFIDVRFLVANPSTYLYFTASRPSESGPAFAPPKETAACPGINAYPFGLNDLNVYGRKVGGNEARMRYPERKVTYLVGGKILNDNLMDRSCAAAAQGPDRLARGRNYARYLIQTFGDALGSRHFFGAIPGAGYDSVALYGSFCGMETLFGNGKCAD